MRKRRFTLALFLSRCDWVICTRRRAHYSRVATPAQLSLVNTSMCATHNWSHFHPALLAGKCQNKRNAPSPAPAAAALAKVFFDFAKSFPEEWYVRLSRGVKMRRACVLKRSSNRMTKHAPQMPPIGKLFLQCRFMALPLVSIEAECCAPVLKWNLLLRQTFIYLFQSPEHCLLWITGLLPFPC